MTDTNKVDVGPMMIYHGRCVIDCGEHGHTDVEMLKMIPAGTKLYSAYALAAQAENKRLRECAQRLVEHADFKLGGILSADSKAKEIPSNAVSQVKARHLAALRDALKGNV